MCWPLFFNVRFFFHQYVTMTMFLKRKVLKNQLSRIRRWILWQIWYVDVCKVVGESDCTLQSPPLILPLPLLQPGEVVFLWFCQSYFSRPTLSSCTGEGNQAPCVLLPEVAASKTEVTLPAPRSPRTPPQWRRHWHTSLHRRNWKFMSTKVLNLDKAKLK